ncbi:hypothetical protein EJ04DRAFT_260242 [Polyplosphaeria fusca]|uniref:Uncharacterized protein n=1 Tax=Polyplosphaeria fusca TaxID=682080 RepID=A0A9P4RBB9_9PLEO|nr:hypothetical protein EJ04DRAFT_260242 [Polyplosphaeria fusca]
MPGTFMDRLWDFHMLSTYWSFHFWAYRGAAILCAGIEAGMGLRMALWILWTGEGRARSSDHWSSLTHRRILLFRLRLVAEIHSSERHFDAQRGLTRLRSILSSHDGPPRSGSKALRSRLALAWGLLLSDKLRSVTYRTHCWTRPLRRQRKCPVHLSEARTAHLERLLPQQGRKSQTSLQPQTTF